jgi:hypothetical protein
MAIIQQNNTLNHVPTWIICKCIFFSFSLETVLQLQNCLRNLLLLVALSNTINVCVENENWSYEFREILKFDVYYQIAVQSCRIYFNLDFSVHCHILEHGRNIF